MWAYGSGLFCGHNWFGLGQFAKMFAMDFCDYTQKYCPRINVPRHSHLVKTMQSFLMVEIFGHEINPLYGRSCTELQSLQMLNL